MSEPTQGSRTVLPLFSVVRLFAVFGFVGGLVSAIVYGIANIGTEPISNLVLALVLAPFLQALVLVAYALIGYFVYARLAKGGHLGLGRIS